MGLTQAVVGFWKDYLNGRHQTALFITQDGRNLEIRLAYRTQKILKRFLPLLTELATAQSQALLELAYDP